MSHSINQSLVALGGARDQSSTEQTNTNAEATIAATIPAEEEGLAEAALERS